MQALHSLHVSLIKHTLEQKQVPNDFISGDSKNRRGSPVSEASKMCRFEGFKNTDEGVQYQRHPKWDVLRASRTGLGQALIY